MARAVIVSVFALLVACTSGELRPADLQPGTACAYCRMTLVDPKLASQIVAPGEEPRVFDDLGCLRAYIAEHPQSGQSAVFVADHSTGAWIPERAAVFTKDPAIPTPMNSHLVAQRAASGGSRDR